MIDNLELTLQLNSPITDEQFEAIQDINFEHVDSVQFHLKNGKDVDFKKVIKGKWIETPDDPLYNGYCSVCGFKSVLYETDVLGLNYCPNCSAQMMRSEAY